MQIINVIFIFTIIIMHDDFYIITGIFDVSIIGMKKRLLLIIDIMLTNI